MNEFSFGIQITDNTERSRDFSFLIIDFTQILYDLSENIEHSRDFPYQKIAWIPDPDEKIGAKRFSYQSKLDSRTYLFYFDDDFLSH